MPLVDTVLGRMGFVRDMPQGPDLRTAPTGSLRNDSGGLENPNTPITAETLSMLLSGGPTASGVPVGERSAMRSTVVYASVALIGGLIGAPPFEVYEETTTGPRKADEHPMTPILGKTANADLGLTSFVWRELMGVHLNLNGNHYAVMERNGAGKVVGVVPLNPNATQVFGVREGMGWRRSYQTTLSDGDTYDIPQEDMVHIPGLGFDGLKGISPIQFVGRQSIGTQLALEESAGRMLANGARVGGVVTKGPGKEMSPGALNELKSDFRGLYQGRANTGEILFLDNGMTFTAAQMSMRDAELLDSRKYSATDIASRIFGVPPFLVGETADMTAWGAGLELIMQVFLLTTMNNRWYRRIENEIDHKFFEGTKMHCMFDRDALMAVSASSRAEYFSKLFGVGLPMNTILRKLHQQTVPGGDEPMVPVNYQPLSKALAADPKKLVPASPAP